MHGNSSDVDPGADASFEDVGIKPSRQLSMLLAVMRALRDPDHGCPWDLEQDFDSIAPYTIEEAYEVADAIERGDFEDLADELGDLLLQVVYHAQMASEAGHFEFGDVVFAVTKKMIRRHPHVFADVSGLSSHGVKKRWEEIKAEERAEKAARKGVSPEELMRDASKLSGIAGNLPALTTALKLQQKASKVGFDWNNPRAVLDKISEESAELVEAIEAGSDETDASAQGRIEEEIGDLLFTAANLARHVDVDPETALRRTNEKFKRRFAHIEATLESQGKSIDAASLEEMELLWQAAKHQDST